MRAEPPNKGVVGEVDGSWRVERRSGGGWGIVEELDRGWCGANGLEVGLRTYTVRSSVATATLLLERAPALHVRVLRRGVVLFLESEVVVRKSLHPAERSNEDREDIVTITVSVDLALSPPVVVCGALDHDVHAPDTCMYLCRTYCQITYTPRTPT